MKRTSILMEVWTNKTSVTGRRSTLDSCTNIRYIVMGLHFGLQWLSMEWSGRIFLKRMAVQWQWIPPVMLSWSEISLYLNYADIDRISSEFGSSKTGQLPILPGKLWPNYGGCFLGSSSPTEVMCRGPLLSGPVTLRLLFVGVPQRKCVCWQATRYSSVAECNWEGIARHNLPNVWAGDDQLLPEAEWVRQKQGLSFKRHYFSCLTIFFKYSYGIHKLQHLLYLLKK